MAAAAAGSGAASVPSPEPPGPEAGPGRAPEEELPALDPAEVRARLERSARQFRNRRKVLIRGLPGDVTNQLLLSFDSSNWLTTTLEEAQSPLIRLIFSSPA